MSKFNFKKHEGALKELGLVDDHDNPTWFTDGKPDLLKMLDIGGANAPKIPVTRRAAIERALFGAQGGGGFALLADPAVHEQILSLRKTMDSPEFKNRYGGFIDAYKQGSSVQQARTGMATFNNLMMDLGQIALPAVNKGLSDLKAILELIRGVLPGGSKKDDGLIGARIGEGALAGAIYGWAGGPGGAVVGAGVGAIAGGVEGVAEQYMSNQKTGQVITGNSVAQTSEAVHSLAEAIRGAAGGPGGVFAGGTSRAPQAVMAPISLSLNIDGRIMAQALSTALLGMSGFPTQAPSADGMGQFYGGDHNYPDK
jgi:hypothetical protein